MEREERRKELAMVTGTPDMKTPCVCGGGIGLISSGMNLEELKAKHSPFCVRFMTICATKYRKSEIRSNDTDTRSTISLLQYVS